MYVWGTANPTGESNESYRGLYLRNRDIDAFIQEMPGKPVKVEHCGPPVGSVVHAWKNKHNGLDCILHIDKSSTLDGAIIASLIDVKYAQDLSLGYRVRMDMSSLSSSSAAVPGGGGSAAAAAVGGHLEKEIVEVSIVKRGMRPHCHIHAHS